MTDYSELKRRLVNIYDFDRMDAISAITALEARVSELEASLSAYERHKGESGKVARDVCNFIYGSPQKQIDAFAAALTTARAEGYAEAIEHAATVVENNTITWSYGKVFLMPGRQPDNRNALEYAVAIRALGESK